MVSQRGSGLDKALPVVDLVELMQRAQGLEVAVVGGGIAGLAVAYALLREGSARVQLFEMLPECGQRSSGKSAAMWLPTENDAQGPRWTRASVLLWNELFAGEGWIQRRGAFKIARDRAQLETHAQGALASGCQVHWLSPPRLAQKLASQLPLTLQSPAWGLLIPNAGFMDAPAMLQTLRAALLDRGGRIFTHTLVDAIEALPGRGWSLRGQGQVLGHFDWVIDAGGALGGRLFEALGYGVQVRALRRHVLRAEPGSPPAGEGPFVWGLDPEFYLRPAPDQGWWLSPCDEDPCGVEDPPLALGPALELWRDRLANWQIASSAPFQATAQGWCGTRNFGPSDASLVGPVPNAPGLARLLGLGGRGMTIALGAAQACARQIYAQNRAGKSCSAG